MEDKFFKLEKLFNERRNYVETNAHRKDGMETYTTMVSTYNNLIKGEVLRLADEFTKAEAEETYAEST